MAFAITLIAAMTMSACTGENEESSSSSPITSTSKTDTEKPASSEETDKTTTSADDTSAETTPESTEETTSSESSETTPAETDETPAETTVETPAETPAETTAETTASSTSNDNQANPTGKVQKIIDTAKSLVGKEFATGECTPEKGFDNSGLIYYVLQNAKVDCPRGLTGQKALGTEKNIFADLKAGDLVFFRNDNVNADDAGFGGIYIGNDEMIFSPYPGQKVCVKNINNTYYKEHFIKAAVLDLA